MPKMYYLVGPPGSGKTTWRLANCPEAFVVSTDDIIERKARENGTTYHDEHQLLDFKDAERELRRLAKEAAEKGRDIVIDRTNMTKKARRRWRPVGGYELCAVVFQVPDETIEERRLERNKAGKYVSAKTLNMFKSIYEKPTWSEGFTSIEFVK